MKLQNYQKKTCKTYFITLNISKVTENLEVIRKWIDSIKLTLGMKSKAV